jgi:Integrase zinc binding domain/Integrase core domain
MIKYLNDSSLPEDSHDALQVMATADCYAVDEDGLLQRFCHGKRGTVIAQWVVPLSLRALLLELAHDDVSAAHAGIASTMSRLFEKYYWIGMSSDAKQYVTSCIICQRRKASPCAQAKQIPAPPRRLWQRMTVDLLDCGITTQRGNRYIIAFVETVSGYCFLFALPSKTAEVVAESFAKVIYEVGAVEELGSDNGGEFSNELMQHMCQAFNIKKTFSSSYHPQGNGQVERLNSRILQPGS